MDIDLKTLPMELIFCCILPKLPAKSLFRFKCVSKSFRSEISSPEFNALFSEANRRLLIRPGGYDTLRVYELASPHSPPALCVYPIPYWFNTWDSMSIVACCESYLLIDCGKDDREWLILLNPTTRFYDILPKSHLVGIVDYLQYGMCYWPDDEFNDQVKVVRFVNYESRHWNEQREVHIYNSTTYSWEIIECEATAGHLKDDPVLVQNHLLVMIFYASDDRVTRIGCFDIKAERWSNDVLLPDTISGEVGSNAFRDGHYYYLGVLDGKLRFSWYDANKATYTTWVMKNYGDKSSWVKLMSLPVQGREEVYHPIAYRKGSSHELLCISKYTGKRYWYCLREKHLTDTESDSNGLDTNCLSFAYICKGNLANFRNGRPIRSSSKLKNKDVDGDNEMLMLDWRCL